MQKIISQEFGGERPLYHTSDLLLEDVVIHAGESSLKECRNIEAVRCRFEGKYPFWNTNGFTIRHSLFTEGGRAALWYSHHLLMEDTLVEAPKMFRDSSDLRLRRVQLPHAAETFWHCQDIDLEDVKIHEGDYIFMNSQNIRIRNLRLYGNYSFQYCKNVEIHDSILHTKDAFWETNNVTVYNSEIHGEFLAWQSRNLRLVNCHLSGSQPLCYCEGLILENCTFDADADLAFEYSSVEATINGNLHSVKNPKSGHITADRIGTIILDDNIKAPADCIITQREAENT